MSDNEQTLVEHADNVEHSDLTNHVDTVEHMAVTTGTPPPTPKVRALKYVMNSLLSIVVLVALVITVLTVVDKNNKEQDFLNETAANRARIEQLSTQVIQQGSESQDKLICGRRFQDKVDTAQAVSTIDFSDLIVLVVREEPGPERTMHVNALVAQLDSDNEVLKAALKAKVDYNNDGNPLPCPVGDTPPEPQLTTP